MIMRPPAMAAGNNEVSNEYRSLVCRLARRSMEPEVRDMDVLDGGVQRTFRVVRRGVGPILTPGGWLWEYHFRVDDQWREYHAIVGADLDNDFNPIFASAASILVRLDSGCTTGQVFADKNCDCAAQLRLAMARIAAGSGVIVSIPAQEGRGKGPGFKLATLALQHHLNLDTYDAARALTDEIDVRTYGGAIGVLKFLGVTPDARIGLMTNNPKKLEALAENDYRSVERVPIRTEVNEHTERHWAAKLNKFGHLE